MNQLRLDTFTQAYRETYSAELDDQAVMRRIRRTLNSHTSERAKPRWKVWFYSMGLTTALGATLAYASPLAQTLLQWVNARLEPSATTSVGAPNTTTPPSEAPPSARPAPAAALPSTPSSPALATKPHNRSQPSSRAVPASGVDARTRPAQSSEPVPHQPGATFADASSLYARAHQLQFDEHSYETALAAWERYLATSDIALKPDARYNHAVCLVHLKRYEQARVELARLVRPGSPAAHRSRAATLLSSLDALPK